MTTRRSISSTFNFRRLQTRHCPKVASSLQENTETPNGRLLLLPDVQSRKEQPREEPKEKDAHGLAGCLTRQWPTASLHRSGEFPVPQTGPVSLPESFSGIWDIRQSDRLTCMSHVWCAVGPSTAL